MARVLFTHRYSMRMVDSAVAVGSYRANLWGADGPEPPATR